MKRRSSDAATPANVSKTPSIIPYSGYNWKPGKIRPELKELYDDQKVGNISPDSDRP